ncbi:MAG: DoxX family protein [Candidatus Marinimicrobia bacterium]|nr:DoxX family protein [Candidatus Neomarinimicrobiota bacterium]MCF7923460.1 DoxX family protein [Candidatus Neomarinimicrobiota bacterium]
MKSIGRYLFSVPFGLFGLMHLTSANDMAGLVPGFIPGGVLWVYLTGLALIAAAVSFAIQKHTYLAGLLTAALMMVFVFTIHLPGVIGGNMMAMSGLLKDIGLAGGALLLASNYQTD